MIQVTVKNNVFTIPKVPRQDISMTKIDWLAKRFYKTRNEEYIGTLICIASRYIKKVASSFCKNVGDAEELNQELKIDLVRLLRGWKPKKELCFHYLMKRQFYNFSCNFVKKIKAPPFVDIDQVQQSLFSGDSFVKNFEIKDLIEKLERQVDDKTKRIFEMMLRGITNFEKIGRELNITGMVVRNRLRRCEPKLRKLLEVKNVSSY
ncbi:MAG: sigma-70 family RNA polymerase sigma factor [Candidatus Cloacimonetes bacterium]|nr:sigma-70 family RNA polymerase sigma factor [Candidatus Cloacimonadota bacterium]